jgi:hypothetical protein
MYLFCLETISYTAARVDLKVSKTRHNYCSFVEAASLLATIKGTGRPAIVILSLEVATAVMA